MENKKCEQLSFVLENAVDTRPQTPTEEYATRPAAVIPFHEKKAERERAKEVKLYKQILALVKHF